MKALLSLLIIFFSLSSFNTLASENNCNFYKNADGNISIPADSCSWRVYGHQSITLTPKGPYTSVWVNMWGNSGVIGDFTTDTLRLGAVRSSAGKEYLEPRIIAFNNRVTINNTLEYDDVTSADFTGGICGNYKCQKINNQAQPVGKPLNQGEEDCPQASAICNIY